MKLYANSFLQRNISSKILSGSNCVGRLRLIGKYIGRRLVAQTEPDKTFWTDRTIDIALLFENNALNNPSSLFFFFVGKIDLFLPQFTPCMQLLRESIKGEERVQPS